MKKIITKDPFCYKGGEVPNFWDRGKWEAKWICHPDARDEESCVYAYFLEFELEKDDILTFHISADQRYLLYIDGKKIGEGPERGDFDNWFFETYELNLNAGKHKILVKSWWISYEDKPPVAQFFWHPAFILAIDGNHPKEFLTTGYANWKVLKIDACKIKEHIPTYTGSRFEIQGKDFPFGYENGIIGNWVDAKNLWYGESKEFRKYGEFNTSWHLRPAILKAPFEEKVSDFNVRHVDFPKNEDTTKIKILKSKNNSALCKEWQEMLEGNGTVIINKNQKRRMLIDLENYYCAYQNLVISGGKNALIRINWAESLFENLEKFEKGNRNQIENKIFTGYGNKYYSGGGEKENFETYWWMSGRYIEIFIETFNEPLEIKSFELTQTHYDYKFSMDFNCNDSNLTDFMPIAYRVMEMCTHETLMDCPYYEQLMYVGDTRLELLTAYASAQNKDIAFKAIDTFDKSIGTSGLTKSRYPSHLEQHIPTFSLFYVAIVYDYAMWIGNINFVKELIHGIRGIMDFFQRNLNKDGLIDSPVGWNFTDWVHGYPLGMTSQTDCGISGYYSIHYMYTLNLAAKLERMLGEKELSERYIKQGNEILKKIDEKFWDNKRNLYSDDLEKTLWWEHTQCLAVLSEFLEEEKIQKIMSSIKEKNDISRTTIYFSHYLTEAAAKAERMDIFFDKFEFWNNLKDNGFTTTPEAPNPARSDCHAWGAHPIYHLQSSILGIKPDSFGFESVIIKPQLHHLKWAKGKMPYKKSFIETDFKLENGILTGKITLPYNLSGKLLANKKEYTLTSGENNF